MVEFKCTQCECAYKHRRSLAAPFVVYADFESVLKPVSGINTTQGVTSGIDSSVTSYQEHIACCYLYKIVSIIPDKPKVWYRGEGAAEKFISELQHEAEEICGEYICTPQEI